MWRTHDNAFSDTMYTWSAALPMLAVGWAVDRSPCPGHRAETGPVDGIGLISHGG